MATITQVRSGLATRLATITGLTVYETVTPTPVVPCVFIRPADGDYDVTMASGGDIARFEITLLASAAGGPWDVAQDKIDAYLTRSGSGTIRGAIQGDVTLGGTAHSTRVTGWRDYGTLAYGGAEYFGVRLTVEAWPV